MHAEERKHSIIIFPFAKLRELPRSVILQNVKH